MKKTTQVKGTYKLLISKSSEETKLETLDLTVERAANKFELGILDIKGKLLEKSSKVKEAEIALSKSERDLEDAKCSKPDTLVQSLVDAKLAIKAAQNELEAVREEYNQLKEIYDFLETTKTELF
jgi:hypothetical protein